MGLAPHLHITETTQLDWRRLTLTGELDLASVKVLEERLTDLREEQQAVLLDLSQLEFIDSTGLHLLVKATGDARSNGWRFRIDPGIPPQIMRLFRLVEFDRIVLSDDGHGH